MIKEIILFNYSKEVPYEEVDQWFFDRHAQLVKRLPHLMRYVSYRALHLPPNDFVSPPQFSRMEELWWPDRELFSIAQSSSENREAVKDLKDPRRGLRVVDVKRALLEREINVLHPEMTGHFSTTMNDLNGKPHVKSLWCMNYLKGLTTEDAERWYLNHHTRVAARNLNLVKYVTYSPAEGLGVHHEFVRFTELCWRDWETMLNDFESPRGQEVLEDNKDKRGEWRVVAKTTFLDHPHVVGNEVVFV